MVSSSFGIIILLSHFFMFFCFVLMLKHEGINLDLKDSLLIC